MARIQVTDLTFCYEGSFDNILENVSFNIDTNWKLGLIGRNGKGKTTFLNLLLGKYEYSGSISTNKIFEYFPYQIPAEYMELPAIEFAANLKAGCEEWRIFCELDMLEVDAEVLYRPFQTLSFGERTKVMLAVLFSGENDFLLIDEPTNHLDQNSREIIKKYLAGKKSFILVSHDRDLLDACIDHVLVLNRATIEVQAGNFSSWWENKAKKDLYALAENEKHKKEIGKLKKASERSRQWAENSEKRKIGYDPTKEPDHEERSYIGGKTKKMQSRVKQLEGRMKREIEEKEGLLQDIETPVDLKIMPLKHHKNVLVSAREYGLQYADGKDPLFENMNFEITHGERVFISGINGCGKSTLIQRILEKAEGKNSENLLETGELQIPSRLKISYINQDTSHLKGSIQAFCRSEGLDESLLCAILRQMDMERVQFEKNMEHYSEGQKKKVLIAASLLTQAHLYVWDEPLNYIDVFSRMQIEKLILEYEPTMLLVEHDARFREQIATKILEMQ